MSSTYDLIMDLAARSLLLKEIRKILKFNIQSIYETNSKYMVPVTSLNVLCLFQDHSLDET